jgi:hypothetical protein
MATLIPFLQDGLVLDFDGDRMTATVPYHITDLVTPPGGDPLDQLAEAMEVAGVPEYETSRNLLGRTIYARRYRIGAWGDTDAELFVTWVEDETALGGTGTVVEVGSTVEVSESDFDAIERDKDWDDRTPMVVTWDPASTGAPSAGTDQPVRLPYFAGKPFRRYTKTISEDPGGMAEDFVGAVNLSPWKGYPAYSVLCMAIIGRNAGEGFSTNFDFAIDKKNLWAGVGRFVDPTTGRVVQVTNAQVAGRNGIKDFQMQVAREFNALPI